MHQKQPPPNVAVSVRPEAIGDFIVGIAARVAGAVPGVAVAAGAASGADPATAAAGSTPAAPCGAAGLPLQPLSTARASIDHSDDGDRRTRIMCIGDRWMPAAATGFGGQ